MRAPAVIKADPVTNDAAGVLQILDEVARQDVFDFIEMFYNLVRRHGYNGNKSPVQFEQQFFESQRGV